MSMFIRRKIYSYAIYSCVHKKIYCAFTCHFRYHEWLVNFSWISNDDFDKIGGGGGIKRFVCLDFLSHSRIFHSFGDVIIAGEELQILTYGRHSWPFSSEGSLACHTYCDTEHPFIMVISEDPWDSHLMPSVLQWSCLNDLRLSRLGFVHPTFRLRSEYSKPLRHATVNM